MEIEIASQEKLRFVEDTVGKLLLLLGHPEALVTDESKLTNFMNFYYHGDKKKEKRWRSAVVKLVKRKSGVDIDPVFTKPLPEVAKYTVRRDIEEARKGDGGDWRGIG